MEILNNQRYGFSISPDGKSIYNGNPNSIKEEIQED